jgi:hypothetical protein
MTHDQRAVSFETTGQFSMEARSVSEGPSVDSGEIVICEERGVPRSRFGFPKTHSRYGLTCSVGGAVTGLIVPAESFGGSPGGPSPRSFSTRLDVDRMSVVRVPRIFE